MDCVNVLGRKLFYWERQGLENNHICNTINIWFKSYLVNFCSNNCYIRMNWSQCYQICRHVLTTFLTLGLWGKNQIQKIIWPPTPDPHSNSFVVSLKNRQKSGNDFGKVSKWYLTSNIVKSTIEVSMQKHY
jgi:hypothetical protein